MWTLFMILLICLILFAAIKGISILGKLVKWIFKGLWTLISFLLLLPFTFFIKRDRKLTQDKLHREWKEEKDLKEQEKYLEEIGKIKRLY